VAHRSTNRPAAGGLEEARIGVDLVRCVVLRVARPATNRGCRADEPRLRVRGESAWTNPLPHRPQMLRRRQRTRREAQRGNVRAPSGAAHTRSGASCATCAGHLARWAPSTREPEARAARIRVIGRDDLGRAPAP